MNQVQTEEFSPAMLHDKTQARRPMPLGAAPQGLAGIGLMLLGGLLTTAALAAESAPSAAATAAPSAAVSAPSTPSASSSQIAGLAPYQRPAWAPTVTKVVHDPNWHTQALHGVTQPVPRSVQSMLSSQGHWYTPFAHAGMYAPYDLRGWHTASQD